MFFKAAVVIAISVLCAETFPIRSGKETGRHLHQKLPHGGVRTMNSSGEGRTTEGSKIQKDDRLFFVRWIDSVIPNSPTLSRFVVGGSFVLVAGLMTYFCVYRRIKNQCFTLQQLMEHGRKDDEEGGYSHLFGKESEETTQNGDDISEREEITKDKKVKEKKTKKLKAYLKQKMKKKKLKFKMKHPKLKKLKKPKMLKFSKLKKLKIKKPKVPKLKIMKRLKRKK